MLTTSLTWRSSCTVVKYIRKTSKICCIIYVTWHEKTGLMYTKYTYPHYGVYLHYCIRFTKSVNFIRFPMNSCINGENCAGLPCVCMKLFNSEIQKCGQILCAHKPYFLMPGHIYIHTYSIVEDRVCS